MAPTGPPWCAGAEASSRWGSGTRAAAESAGGTQALEASRKRSGKEKDQIAMSAGILRDGKKEFQSDKNN
jgi:hypothetical protein